MVKQQQLRNRLDKPINEINELAFYPINNFRVVPKTVDISCARCIIQYCNCDECKAWLDIYREHVPHVCVDI